MADQLRLDDYNRAACDAAAQVRRDTRATAMEFATGQRRRIFDALVDAESHGLTADDIEAALHMAGNSVRPRLMELREEGRIHRTTESRRTRSGSLAMIYRVTP